jgi:predicted esterase
VSRYDDPPRLEQEPPSTAPEDSSGGRLRARPHDPKVPPEAPGLHQLGLDSRRDGLLYVPAGYRPDNPAPLVVMLHGAGGNARGGIEPFLPLADDAGLLLVAPRSRAPTWDVIGSSYGADVAFIDRVLSHVFDRFAVDPGRLAIEGFSDGASYALSLGLSNGDLFTHLIAFSPGFCAPSYPVDSPKIFITHGTEDRVLPIDRTSRILWPRLEGSGYDVVYDEFRGGHTVPAEEAKRAVDWFLH